MLHGVAGLLIAAAAGYWVLTQAQKEKNQIKILGQWLGVILIAVSLVGTACKIYYLTTGKPVAGLLSPAAKVCPFCGKAIPR